ncbi:hypothetical protein PILCRDRAFT_741352 [Piloderma croceum F 1598]|uniref:Uncharacterized protein n=1 Tax=Piloderma croceum (strain F 1598) TaxID=765440 RepID=A0A0C3AF45_PILCF|nr:hypothetical protein PILCRDRAFT_741352 [Piloderma croceum F 1598]
MNDNVGSLDDHLVRPSGLIAYTHCAPIVPKYSPALVVIYRFYLKKHIFRRAFRIIQPEIPSETGRQHGRSQSFTCGTHGAISFWSSFRVRVFVLCCVSVTRWNTTSILFQDPLEWPAADIMFAGAETLVAMSRNG